MRDAFPKEINAAIRRCSAASGEEFRLPWDFECYPVLKISGTGRCVGIRFWLARIGAHIGRGSTAELAVAALCPNNNGGVK